MSIRRIALISVHTSPLAQLGGRKTGGMNVYVQELARELGRQNLYVDIFTRRISPQQAEIDTSLGQNVRVIHIQAGGDYPLGPEESYPHLSQFTAGLIAFATRANIHYDMIYSHYWLSGWVANKLKEVWGTPFVHMFHTLGHMKNRILPGSASALPDERITVETQIVEWADRIIAATPAEYQQLLWLYRADRRRITIISPGVNTNRFHPVPLAKARETASIAPNENMLVFVGRLEPLKGVDTILEALHGIKLTRPTRFETLRLKIIGGDLADTTDQELSRLQKRVAELGLQDVVTFLGAKSQELLPAYYASALAVIVPSDYESFGLVALEAMASGALVIASEVGGLAFLVRDGETGFLVPVRDPQALANRILYIMDHPSESAQMRQSATALADEYTWPQIVTRLLEVFNELRGCRRPIPHTS